MKAAGITLLALVGTWPTAALSFSASTKLLGPDAVGTATGSAADEAVNDHRALLESLETRIDQFDVQIASTKEKVDLLKDTALGGVIARCKAIISHRNEMGAGFVLERATYTLDGGVIFSQEDSAGSLDTKKEFELFNGAIPPGDHKIEVSLVYRGSSLGFFTYLQGYKFQVESKYNFQVQNGKLNKLSIVSYAKGDITTETADRLAVRYDVDVLDAPAVVAPESPEKEQTPDAVEQ